MSLAALFTKKHNVEYNGFQFSIKDLTVEDLPIVMSIVEKAKPAKNSDIVEIVTNLLKNSNEELLQLIAKLTGFELSDVKEFSLDASTFILVKAITLNTEFVKKTLPSLLKDLQIATGEIVSNS